MTRWCQICLTDIRLATLARGDRDHQGAGHVPARDDLCPACRRVTGPDRV